MCDPGDILPFVPSLPTLPGLPSLPIGPTYPIWGPFIFPDPKPDFSHVDKKDDIEKAQTRLKELEGNGYKKDPANVIVEDFSGETFDGVYNKMKDALKPSATHDSADWGDVRSAIVEAIQNFKIALGTLEGSEEAWKGKTHDAALQNLETSYPEPTTAADGAGVQGILEDAFIRTIAATQDNIVSNKSRYDDALRDFPEQQDNIKKQYSDFAYNVLTDVYRPGIVEIGKDNPAFTAGVKLDVGPNGPGPTGPGPFGPGATGPGPSGGGGLPSPPSTPKLPEFDPTKNLPKTPEIPDTPDLPTTPPGTPTLPQSLGQVPDTGSPPATGGAPSPTGATGQPPEGVLGLGPKGLGGAPKGVGAKGGGAGGKAGGGAGAKLPRGLAPGKATATPAAAIRTPAAGGAAAGLAGMGAPGAGAPAAGAGGRDGNKAYAVSKALRRKKTGQQIAGEAEAVVPVVGAPEKPMKPEAGQPDRAPHADPPDDAGGVRTVSRAPQSTEPATRMPGQ